MEHRAIHLTLLTSLLLALALIRSAPAVAVPAPDTTIVGRVATVDGRPVPGVWVLALPTNAAVLSAAVRADDRGRFQLRVPNRRHHLGVASPGWQVVRMVTAAGGDTELQVRPVFASHEELQGALARSGGQANLQAVALAGGGGQRFAVVRGRVKDRGGTPLPGVRVIVVNPLRQPVGAAFTNPAGEFTVLAPAGELAVHVVAAGFKLGSSAVARSGALELVMEIDAAPETIVVSTGHVLRFRLSDSSWPEYVPPPPVAAWLRYAYGINLDAGCPTRSLPSDERTGARVSATAVGGTAGRGPSPVSCPTSVAVKGRAKYWWLRLLEAPPPNPAQLASWDED